MSQDLDMTLGELLDRTAGRIPDCEALVDLDAGRRLTWLEFSEQTDLLARGLMALGLEPGHHLALWGGSTITWILTQYAAAKIGIVVVSADPDYGSDQMAYLLDQSDAGTLVMIGGYKDRNYPDILVNISPDLESPDQRVDPDAKLPHLRRVILADENERPGFIPWRQLAESAEQISEEALQERKAGVKSSDVTLISYTSGTTGPPKGVMCTHFGLINKTHLSARVLGLRQEDRMGLCVPLYHMFGNTCVLLTGITQGATMVLFGQYFEAEQALRGLAEGRCSIVFGAPSQFIALMEHPSYSRLDLTPLRGGIMGGAPCPMEVMKKVVEDMGIREILVGYGQTEASSWVTLTRPNDSLEVRVSTIGRPLDQTEVKVVDPATGNEVPAGRAGEMCTRGFLMAGYYKMPAATAQAVDADGWLHTGDLITLDENGNGRIMGRIKDLIVKGDLELSPIDIEEILFAHPDVVEAAVFGLPGDDGREQVAAWIKVRQEAVLSERDLVEFCRQKLPPEAVPTLIHFTESFPMTATGKIQKFKMREITQARMKSGVS